MCTKSENKVLLEILISRGAHFIFNDFCNNIVKIDHGVNDQKKYYTYSKEIKDKNKNPIEIHESYILRVNDLGNQNLKDFFKYSRIRNYMFIFHLAKSKLLVSPKAQLL